MSIKLIGAASDAKRDEVVQRFLPALALRGDEQRGKAVFQSIVNPATASAAMDSPSGRIWPAREAAGKRSCWSISWTPTAKFHRTTLVTSSIPRRGASYAGLIVNETASSVTVRQPLGIEVVVPRSQIAKMHASIQSLMPEWAGGRVDQPGYG